MALALNFFVHTTRRYVSQVEVHTNNFSLYTIELHYTDNLRYESECGKVFKYFMQFLQTHSGEHHIIDSETTVNRGISTTNHRHRHSNRSQTGVMNECAMRTTIS